MRTSRQRGIVLGATLILLLMLTLLGVAGLTTAVAALAMSGAGMRSALAFEAAEAGIARVLASATYDAAAPVVMDLVPIDAVRMPTVTVETRVAPALTPRAAALPEGFSLSADDTAFEALPFEITATGHAARATATHAQGFYVIVPPAH